MALGNCVIVWRWVIWVAPRRVPKVNWSIEVATSEHRVLTFGLSGWYASNESRRTPKTVLDRCKA